MDRLPSDEFDNAVPTPGDPAEDTTGEPDDGLQKFEMIREAVRQRLFEEPD